VRKSTEGIFSMQAKSIMAAAAAAELNTATPLADSHVRVALWAIDMDPSIQCRASINMSMVNEYAQSMEEGDVFPPIDLYGTQEKCWVGDGWHRIEAAKSRDEDSINAILHEGGRAEALKHALGANARHGLHRSHVDKRRCVEIALREFSTLSSRAIADMCGVGPDLVLAMRPLSENDNATTTTKDGRQYPVRQKARAKAKETVAERQAILRGARAGMSEQEVLTALAVANVPPEVFKAAVESEHPPTVAMLAKMGKRSAPEPEVDESDSEPESEPDYTGHSTARRTPTAPANGMWLAGIAVRRLEEITEDDLERGQAFRLVSDWLLHQYQQAERLRQQQQAQKC
jgi:hypothetical protein